MGTKVFTNISLIGGTDTPDKPLRGEELSKYSCIQGGYIVIEDGVIAECGGMNGCKYTGESLPEGTMVLPAWCDSHTHLVFADSRETEFVQKIQGATYSQIALAGGGILNSAKKIAAYSEDQLFDLAWKRLGEVSRMGTGAIEIKSGYGLSFEGELKMLRVIKRLKKKSPLIIKSTFLGAHAYPAQYKENHEGYIKMIIDDLLPVIAAEQLADFIDVFCEQGFFSVEAMHRICAAGKSYGLKPKLHVNQLSSMGAIEAGMAIDALSMDHLETVTENDIRLLGNFRGISTLLPTAAMFLRMDMPPARKLITSDAAIALATDFNPGSSPSGNMNLVVSLACIMMRMLPEEALNAATINGAFAMDTAGVAGSVSIGKRANLIFTKPVPSLPYLPYAFGENHIERVMINGTFI